MKKIILLFLSFGVVSCGQVKQQVSEQARVNVMSYNIRYDNPEDGMNNWQYRKDRAATAIRFYDVDILGTQEVLHNQLEDLKQRLPEYGVIGVGREDGKVKGEYSALWYKKARFELLASGYFWLSETPDIASWGKLKDKISGKEYFALNTHLDHIGVVARREGVSLILDRVNELSDGLPVIVTGDFNAEPESDVIKHMTDAENPKHLQDTRLMSPIVYLKVLRYGVLAETEGSEFLSDHAPVLVTVE